MVIPLRDVRAAAGVSLFAFCRAFRYEFESDPAKAHARFQKHAAEIRGYEEGYEEIDESRI